MFCFVFVPVLFLSVSCFVLPPDRQRIEQETRQHWPKILRSDVQSSARFFSQLMRRADYLLEPLDSWP
ncbi:MAG: hypothetical protein CMJ50_10495 [Planctomycetaceae bacterium]|nr:hypothetical protein [Planctomycetaceae bacterium]